MMDIKVQNHDPFKTLVQQLFGCQGHIVYETKSLDIFTISSGMVSRWSDQSKGIKQLAIDDFCCSLKSRIGSQL
jgi:hypothetical protein